MSNNENKLPLVESGYINVAFSEEDLITFVQFMNITANTFKMLATQATQQNEDKTHSILENRYQLALAFTNKLTEFYKTGEPTSRKLH